MSTDTEPAAAVEEVPDAPDAPAPAWPSWWSVAGRWLRRVWSNPPEIARTPQPSLADIVAYSRTGEWTAAATGAAVRAAHTAYTYLIAVPAAAAAYWLRWVAERPARLGTGLAAAVLIGTGLARIPGPGWLVPGFLDATTWL